MLNPELVAPSKLLDILIIGGGLSGLMAAHEIQRTLPSASWKLLEAQPHLGGRLNNDLVTNEIDLGGAWIWPQQQPFMKKLVKDLKIPTFRQPDDPSSTRMEGGAVQFIHALAKKLPKENLLTGSPVKKCTLLTDGAAEDDQCTSSETEPVIKIETTENETLFAKRVVVAVPPKLASLHISFEPSLSETKQEAMASSHTWMAGVTKIALVYPKRFWDTQSSNNGFPSYSGPAFQVYDASTKDGSIAALTFFAMVPPNSEAVTDNDVLADQVSSQMEGIWKYFRQPEMAQQAKSYTAAHVKRWPLERYISEDSKPTSIHPHPHPVAALSQSEWTNRLLFAGSETDRGSPGVMEGAVSAAMRVVSELQALMKTGK